MSTELDTHCTSCGRRQCVECKVLITQKNFEFKENLLSSNMAPQTYSDHSKSIVDPSQREENSATVVDTNHLTFSTSAPGTYVFGIETDFHHQEDFELPCVDTTMGGKINIGGNLGQQDYETRSDNETTASLEPDVIQVLRRSIQEKGTEASKTDLEPESAMLEAPPIPSKEGPRYAMSESEESEFGSDDEQLDDEQLTNATSPSDPPRFLADSTLLMISQWLESLKDDPNYGIIVQVCENAIQNLTINGGNTRAQDVPEPSNHTDDPHSNKRRQKRKASDLDNDNEANAAPSTTTANPLAKNREKQKFACHFWKKNQNLYADCGRARYGKICHLTEHLRREHGPKENSCRICWRPFNSPEALLIHHHDANELACIPTGGIPVHELRVSRAHMGDCKKWFWVWDQLFPGYPRPKSPYWESLNSDDQLFSNLMEYVSADLATRISAGDLATVMDSLTRYRDRQISYPAEPVPSIGLPTPATTRASDDSEELRVNLLQPSQTEESQALSLSTQDPFETDMDTLLPWTEDMPSIEDFGLMPQESADSIIGTSTETALFRETSPSFFGANPDIWDTSLDYDESTAFDVPYISTDELGNIDQLDCSL
ncbi:hypothetical protein F5Y13DRAFT_180297 [Hypoxylon sp. FL1857]|nr:hypothetical protein F5Y13DRAFT_180297 [Hypoxylon sp. FL1857]